MDTPSAKMALQLTPRKLKPPSMLVLPIIRRKCSHSSVWPHMSPGSYSSMQQSHTPFESSHIKIWSGGWEKMRSLDDGGFLTVRIRHSPEDKQSTLFEASSKLRVLFRTTHTHKEDHNMMSLQIKFVLSPCKPSRLIYDRSTGSRPPRKLGYLSATPLNAQNPSTT